MWSAPRPLVMAAEFGRDDVELAWCARLPPRRLLGQPAAFRDRVDADDPHARSDQQLDDQLTDQAEADDARGISELDLARRTPCMAMDATVANAACSGWTPSGTATHRLTGTQLNSAWSACSLPAHATSWPTLNSSAPRPTSVDDSAERIAERGVGVELVHHLLVGGTTPCCCTCQAPSSPGRAGRVPCRPATSWPRYLHHLGASGDQRVERSHEHAARAASRGGHVEDGQLPRPVVLRNLFHRSSLLRVPSCRHHPATPAARYLAVPQLQREELPDLLGAVLRPARSSSTSSSSACLRRNPRSTSSPLTSTSSMSSRRSLRTHARSGAPNEALGRWTISLGSQASAASLRATFACPAPDLLRARKRERGLRDDLVDERHPDLHRRGHAGPVGVGEVEPRAGTSGRPPGTSG